MSIPIEALSEPFPADLIKQRKGNFGSMLDYIDAATVIQRLNEVLEGEWSFTVLDHQIDPDEVIVRGQMEIHGVIRQQFGGSSITRKSDSGETISIADDLKAASADCLKKCASSFGVGLYLYSSASDKAEGHGGDGRRSSGNSRVTNEQIAQIFSSAKAAGVQQSQVIKAAMEAYGKPISQLTQKQAQELIDQFTVTKSEGG